MISPKFFYDTLASYGIDFYAGVPDSLLKNLCAYITDHADAAHNIIAANEGGAMGLAAGHYLATGQIPIVYMQNSGEGNIINPLASLTDPDVYNIPVLLVIGWRGKPGVHDEPQHVKQGKVTTGLLNVMGIDYTVLSLPTPHIHHGDDSKSLQAAEEIEQHSGDVRKGGNQVRIETLQDRGNELDFLFNHGEVQRAEPQAHCTQNQQGQAAFRHLGAQDLIGAVGGHEQHVSLAGVHILVQGDQAQNADKEETEHGGHHEKDDAQCLCVALISQASVQEDTFHNQDNRENKEFRESGFPEFVF